MPSKQGCAQLMMHRDAYSLNTGIMDRKHFSEGFVELITTSLEWFLLVQNVKLTAVHVAQW